MKKNYNKRFYLYALDLSVYFFTTFGFLIYLEIIELRFCKLDNNLRRYIEKRRVEDIIQNKEYEGFNEEDEKNKYSIVSELESESFLK